MQTTTTVESGETKVISVPSVDIFKAIFEDDDEEDDDSTEDDEIEDHQEPNKNEASEGYPHGSCRNKILGKGKL